MAITFRSSKGSFQQTAGQAALDSCSDDTCAQRFRQDQDVARTRVRIGEHAPRRHEARYRESVNWFRVANRMPTEQNASCFLDFRRASAKDRINDMRRHQVRRNSHEVQRRQRAAPHGIHVRQCIRRGDLSVGKRIVNDRREKIGRLHQRSISVDSIHPCVISSGSANQEIAILKDR